MPTVMVPLQATLQPCTTALFMAESMSYLLSLRTSVFCSAGLQRSHEVLEQSPQI